MSRFIVCAASMILLSCFQTPVLTQGTLTSKSASKVSKVLAGTLADNGVATAMVTANSTETQLVNVPSGSTVAGSSLSLPPGALSISTQILIEEATPLTTATSLSELSIQSEVLQQGTAVSIQASDIIDAKVPMTIAIPLPTGFGLAGPDYTAVSVLYRVTRNDQSSNVSGIIPYAQITFDNGFAKVQSLYFGAYQVVVTSVALAAKEVKVETPAFTVSTLENKPKITISSASEVVIQKNRSITIHGTNFRSNMVLALGTTKISNLKVASDVQASFVAVDGDRGGRMALTAEQDGATSSIPVFFLPSAEDLPIITLLPAEVCLGIRYFDRSGLIQVGLRNCTADIAGLSAGDLRNGVKVGGITGSLPVYSSCSIDGEVGCVVLGPTFASVSVSGAAAKILAGQTVGGINGTALGRPVNCSSDGGTECVATAAYPAALFDGAAAKIASGVTLAGITGTASARPPDCSSDGGTACVAVTSFPAVDKVNLLAVASKIRSIQSIAGVSGTLADCSTDGGLSCFTTVSFPAALSAGAAAKILTGQTLGGVSGSAGIRPVDCTGDNQTSCVAMPGYPSVDLSILSPGVIKTGVTVAGVSGQYPSISYPLLPVDGHSDLDLATFNTKIKSPSNFGWFDRNGTRHVTMGDSDITGTNIKSGFDIFGTSGTISNCTSDGEQGCITIPPYKAANTAAFNTWDIRFDKTIAGVPGSIVFNKNTASLTTFNRISGVMADPSSGVADKYDTIDDYNSNLGLPSYNAFLETANTTIIFDPISDNGLGGAIANNGSCESTEECIFKDQNTGLSWRKDDGAARSWEQAISYCDASSYGGYSGWRVPTQKEFLMAGINRIWDHKASLNLTPAFMWTATTSSGTTTNAYAIDPSTLLTSSQAKNTNTRVICVRP